MESNYDHKALIVFAKNLEKGKVKTRLAKEIGTQKALEIYKECCIHTMTNTFDIPARKMLFYSDYIENGDLWGSDDFAKFVQNGNDLGDRMMHAFRVAFDKSVKAIIIGTDCMELTRDLINEAFDRLDDHDFVVGPANDGGYYLLGMNAFYPELFQNMEWSTDTVLEKTLSKINAEQSVYRLPELIDIDTIEDLEKSMPYGDLY